MESKPVHKVKVVRPGEGECVAMTGNLYTFQAVAEDTDGAYTFFEGVAPPALVPRPMLTAAKWRGSTCSRAS